MEEKLKGYSNKSFNLYKTSFHGGKKINYKISKKANFTQNGKENPLDKEIISNSPTKTLSNFHLVVNKHSKNVNINKNSNLVINESSSSHEKGTMTEPVTIKKSRQKPISTAYSNLQSILQSISKNKAGDKVPIVILSKSPNKLAKQKIPVYTDKLSEIKPVLNRSNSDERISETEDNEIVEKIATIEQNIKNLLTNRNNLSETSNSSDNLANSSLKELLFNSPQASDEESNHLNVSPDFIGFTTSPTFISNKKNVARQLDKPASNPDSGMLVFDHAYSNSFSNDNSKPDKIKTEELNYPYVSRSVFGSPTSTKTPPDIMLHNDKINILRQMSKVFNEESSKKDDRVSKNLFENTSKNSLFNKENSLSNSTSNCEESLILSASSFSKDLENEMEIHSISESLSINNNSDENIIDSHTSNKIQNSSTQQLDPLVEKQNLDKISKEQVICNLDRTEQKQNSLDTQKEIHDNDALEYLSKKNDIRDNESCNIRENKSCNIREKDNQVITEKDESINTDLPIHLVSSHSLDKEESIRVKSYIGFKGEHVDIIDGFTFYSFKSEEDMQTFTPSKTESMNRRKRKNRRSIKPREKVYTSSGVVELINDKKSSTNVYQSLNNGKSNKLDQEFKNGHCDTLETSSILSEKIEKNISKELSSAFASNDLDQYLEAHSRLKITFPIPPTRYVQKDVSSSLNNVKSKNELIVSKSSINNESPISHLNNSFNTAIKVVKDVINKERKSKYLPESINKNNNSSNLYVKRSGKLLPLSKVLNHKDKKDKNDPIEIVYVYHSGKLLTLGGSLAKVNPSLLVNVKAKVALPIGQENVFEHKQKVSAKKVKVVEINEDMAKFAVSALQQPHNNKVQEKNVFDRLKKPDKTESVKPSKENILDILTAKLSLEITEEKELPNSTYLDNLTNQVKLTDSFVKNLKSPSCPEESGKDNKIKWNQNDVLKRSVMICTSEQSKGFNKNINRFPSLSREMKRLNMNYVDCDENSQNSTENVNQDDKTCNNEYCSLGCICQSLKCHKRMSTHCGKPECMFNCVCSHQPLNSSSERRSIMDKHQNKKDKETLMTPNCLEVPNGEKKKRERKYPERFKDYYDPVEDSEYIFHAQDGEMYYNCQNLMKSFSLNVPWYDLKGVSTWCMNHSCYDCDCFSNRFKESDKEEEMSDTNSIETPSFTQDKSNTYSETITAIGDKLVRLPHKNGDKDGILDSIFNSKSDSKIVHLQINYNNNKNSNSGSRDGFPDGKWLLKHWIHNSVSHCARTSGYDMKKVKKVDSQQLSHGLSIVLKEPFIMGMTLKSSNVGFTSLDKKETCTKTANNSELNASDLERSVYKKAKFVHGLGKDTPLCTNIPTNSLNKLATVNGKPDSDSDQSITEKHKSSPESGSEISESEPKTSCKLTESDSINIINAENVSPTKILSLHEMISDEEKRGELEIDLSDNTEGRTLLISEARFRKLINMNIVGIVGLNKRGRCIIKCVSSTEDLIKMQKIQQLISNNALDVGPNMREIFAPPNQAEVLRKLRYVMIRCDNVGKWEIVGVVQKKFGCDIMEQKPKRQKQQPLKGLKISSISSLSKSSPENFTQSKELPEIIVESIEEISLKDDANTVSINHSDFVNSDKISSQGSSFLVVNNKASKDSSVKPNLASIAGISSSRYAVRNFLLNQSSAKIFGYKGSSPAKASPNLEMKQFKKLVTQNTIMLHKTKTMMSNKNPSIYINPPKPSLLNTAQTVPSVLNMQILPSSSNVSSGRFIKSPVTNLGNQISVAKEPLKRMNLLGSTTENSQPQIAFSVGLLPSGIEVIPSNYTSILPTQSANNSPIDSTGTVNDDALTSDHLTLNKDFQGLSTLSLSRRLNENCEVASKSELKSSPDIKCVGVKSHDNSTAVDLSIKFQSIKLHWLSGAIKKDILLHIYDVSKKNNQPISLFGKHETLNETFYGIHKTCQSGEFLFPVLILGSKVSAIFAAKNLRERELFRCNTVKYLIKDDSSNLCSYTYDVRGKNLIKIASKERNASQLHKFGQKIPVEEMREKLEMKESNFLEEITIVDSEEGEKKEEQMSYCETQNHGPKRALLSELLEETNSKKRKMDATSSSSDVSLQSTSDIFLNLSDDSRSNDSINIVTSDIEQPFSDNLLRDKDLNESINETHLFSKNINKGTLNGLILGNNESLNNLCSSINKDSNVQETDKFNSVNLLKNKIVTSEDDPKSDGEGLSKITQNKLKDKEIEKAEHVNLSQVVPHDSNASEKAVKDFDVGISHKESSLLWSTKSIISEDVNKGAFAAINTINYLDSSKKSGNSSSPNAKRKTLQSKLEHWRNLGRFCMVSPTNKGSLLLSPKKSLNILNKKEPNSYEERIATMNNLVGQEFQQIFCGDPQFLEMDTIERHNALERIRRKGLAKLFNHLYSAIRISSAHLKLPPKHVVLQRAEEVINELKSDDVRLSHEEIKLRSKRMELLNTLSELLKDVDEDVQKDMEMWISLNICNPTAKEVFERSWKPTTITFEDESIKSSTAGEIMLKGADITTYFEAHTRGANALTSPLKISPRKKLAKRSPSSANRTATNLKSKFGEFINMRKLSSMKLKNSGTESKTFDSTASDNSSTSDISSQGDLDKLSVVPPPH